MSHPRRGFTLLEISACCALLVVILVVAMQVLSMVAQSRGRTQRQTTATTEAANAMERLAALPWDRLTPPRVAQERLSASAAAMLAEGELKATVDNVPAEPGAKRIHVEVHWREAAGQPTRTVGLTSWKYQTADRK